jgi:hypothetical protein
MRPIESDPTLYGENGRPLEADTVSGLMHERKKRTNHLSAISSLLPLFLLPGLTVQKSVLWTSTLHFFLIILLALLDRLNT